MNNSNVIRYSTRIGGKVTSLSLNKNIVALYLTMHEFEGNTHDFMLDTLHDMTTKWDGDTGKKLSEYVNTQLITSILEKEDKKTFKKIKETINGQG